MRGGMKCKIVLITSRNNMHKIIHKRFDSSERKTKVCKLEALKFAAKWSG
jgi:hypothetical protein